MQTFSELELEAFSMEIRFSSLDRDKVDEPTYGGRVYSREYTIVTS